MKVYEKTCHVCGKTYETTHRSKLYCDECERLQGLPDGWAEGGSDAARYKAVGNGMAQPCADFVIRRIVESGKKGIDNTPSDVV